MLQLMTVKCKHHYNHATSGLNSAYIYGLFSKACHRGWPNQTSIIIIYMCLSQFVLCCIVITFSLLFLMSLTPVYTSYNTRQVKDGHYNLHLQYLQLKTDSKKIVVVVVDTYGPPSEVVIGTQFYRMSTDTQLCRTTPIIFTSNCKMCPQNEHV